MSGQPDAPKVFISYSWDSIQHQQKVIELANRLMSNRVHALIDVWDLQPGQDKNQFMERIVTDPTVKKVLLICSKNYKSKADSRSGGVGTESLIMSSEIYGKAEQTKFIPVIFESDDRGEPYLPVFVHSRIYINLQSEEVFEENYEKLLRDIFDKPTHRRPPLGVKPSYLDEEEPVILPTAHRVKAIKNAFDNERKNAPLLVKEYYKVFLRAVRDFEPKEGEFKLDNYIELALSRIDQMLPLRNDFIAFLEVYCTAAHTFDEEAMHDFFEELAQYFVDTRASNAERNLGSVQYDYLRFFVCELLLYLVAVTIRHGQFKALAAFLHDSYVVSPHSGAAETETFMVFGAYNFTLNDEYNKKYGTNRSKITGDKVKERVKEGYSFEELQQADVLLHYVSIFQFLGQEDGFRRWLWQPDTTVYHAQKLPLFERMVSQRHFEKTKGLLDVATKDELSAKLVLFRSARQKNSFYAQLRHSYWGLPDIERVLNPDKIGTVK